MMVVWPFHPPLIIIIIIKHYMDTRSSLELDRQGVIADKKILQWIQHCMFNIQHS